MAHKIEEILSTRPPTTTVQSRLDMRTVASLYLFWVNQGEQVRSISELVRLSLEVFSDFLISSERAEKVEGQEEALLIIERAGLKTKYMDSRNKTLLIKQLQKESLVTDGLDPAYLHKKRKKDFKYTDSHPDVQEALRRMEGDDLKEQPNIKASIDRMLEKDKDLDELGSVPEEKEEEEK